MMGASHLATGLAAWTAVETLAGPPRLVPLALGGLAAGAGVLLPDIDRRGLGHWLFLGHRKLTHTGLAASVVGTGLGAAWLAGAVPPWAAAAFSLGYLVHLAGDSLTRSGVPWGGPFTWRPLWLAPPCLRFSTGGKRHYRGGWLVSRSWPLGERIAVAVTVLLAAGAVWWRWLLSRQPRLAPGSTLAQGGASSLLAGLRAAQGRAAGGVASGRGAGVASLAARPPAS